MHQHILQMHQQGISVRKIAEALGIARQIDSFSCLSFFGNWSLTLIFLEVTSVLIRTKSTRIRRPSSTS